MAPGITFDKQLAASLKENLKLKIEFEQDSQYLTVRVIFRNKIITSETQWLRHYHAKTFSDHLI